MVTCFDVNNVQKSWRGSNRGRESTRLKEQEVEQYKKRNLIDEPGGQKGFQDKASPIKQRFRDNPEFDWAHWILPVKSIALVTEFVV